MSKHIKNIEKNLIQEKIEIKKISQKYIQYIKYLNNNKKSSSKNFYIILKYENKKQDEINIEENAIENLNQKYFKIKDSLSRCGNLVVDINNKKNIINILFSFLNSRKYLNNN